MSVLRIMILRYFLSTICLSAMTLGTANAQISPSPSVQRLVAQLSDPRTTSRDTARQILKLSTKDPDAHDYVVRLLPQLIQAEPSDAWMNAVWLAGQMKATEAIPTLIDALPRSRPAELTITLGGLAKLDNDNVAKALSQIGDPAIPPLGKVLKSTDPGIRRRAVLILTNMNTPAARNALQAHLSEETSQELRGMIDDGLKTQAQ